MNSLEESISTKPTAYKAEASPLASFMKSTTKNGSKKTPSMGSATSSVFTVQPIDESPPPSSSSNGIGFTFPGLDMKTILIIILIILIVLSYLGINLLNVFGDGLQNVINITSPTVMKILAALGYTTGEVLNVGADVAAETVKTGADIAEGAVQNVGNLLIDASQEADPTYELKKSIHTPRNHSTRPNEPKADSSEGTIQKAITSGKQNWCLVGEHQNRRGCIAIAESDKCLSGQVFPNEHMCLNPTMTP